MVTQLAGQSDSHTNGIIYGEISGYISDAESNEVLSDVNVLVKHLNTGDASSADGTFLIKKIPPGIYDIEFNRLGFHVKILKNVVVKPGRLTVRNVRLEPDYIRIDDIVFTATKSDQTAQMAPASINVLKSEDMQSRNISTFDQALEAVPGVTLQRTMGVSVQSLSLRGSSQVAGAGVGNRVLLAVDGRPALSSDTGGALWSLVPTNFIDRIEIVKGAYSSLYGSTAMGGVINVITKKPGENSFTMLDMSGGMYELPPKTIRYQDSPGFFSNLNLSHSNRFGKLAYLLSLSRKQSQGYKQRSAYEFYNLYGKLFFDFSSNRNLEVTLGGDIGRNDYPHSWFSDLEPLKIAPKGFDNEQQKRTFNTDVYYYAIPNPRVKYSSRFYFYRQLFLSDFNEDDPDLLVRENEPLGTFTRSLSRKIGNITQLDYYLSERNYLIAGLDLQRDLIDSTPDSILYGKHSVNNFAIYAQDEHDLTDKLTLNFGLRYDYNKREGGRGFNQFSPKTALVYSLTDRWSVRFLVGRAFRAPSISEQFFKQETSSGTRFKPNPDLNAEKVTSLEIGNRLRLGNWADFDLALFRSTYHDMLYWINIAEELGVSDIIIQVRNLSETRLQGIETSLVLHPSRAFNLNMNYTYLDAKDLSETVITGTLAYKIKHTFNFAAIYNWRSWLLNVDGRYNSKVEEVFLFPNNKPDAFFILNGKLRYRFNSKFNLSVGVNNIFAKQYEEMARYRMPGRTWIVGGSYEF